MIDNKDLIQDELMMRTLWQNKHVDGLTTMVDSAMEGHIQLFIDAYELEKETWLNKDYLPEFQNMLTITKYPRMLKMLNAIIKRIEKMEIENV